MSAKNPKIRAIAFIAFAVLLLPLILPIAVLVLLLHVIRRAFVNLMVWTLWVPRGKSALMISSDSPVWGRYMEEEVWPILSQRSERLNWSQRNSWPRLSLSVQVFRSFKFHRAYNPMVIVFRPLRPAKIFRYFEAFRDFKHGKPEQVKAITGELQQSLSE